MNTILVNLALCWSCEVPDKLKIKSWKVQKITKGIFSRVLWLQQESLWDISPFFSHSLSPSFSYSQTVEVIIITHQTTVVRWLLQLGKDLAWCYEENYWIGFACTVCWTCVFDRGADSYLSVCVSVCVQCCCSVIHQLFISNMCIKRYLRFLLQLKWTEHLFRDKIFSIQYFSALMLLD